MQKAHRNGWRSFQEADEKRGKETKREILIDIELHTATSRYVISHI